MPPRPLLPPKYLETHRYIFDKRTGEVLATETRWVEEGVKRTAKVAVARELLASLTKQAGRKAGDLDVIEAPPAAERGRVRVDVKSRKVIVDKTGRDSDRTVLPAPPERP